MVTSNFIQHVSISLGTSAENSIMDHWGTNDEDELIFEPYGEHDELAEEFAVFLGLEGVVIGEPASWHPSCRRYRFQRPREEWSRGVMLLAAMMDESDWEFKHRCVAEDQNKRLKETLARHQQHVTEEIGAVDAV